MGAAGSARAAKHTRPAGGGGAGVAGRRPHGAAAGVSAPEEGHAPGELAGALLHHWKKKINI